MGCLGIPGRPTFSWGKTMTLEIQTGTPPEAGRYVVFTPCKSRQIRDWCEPHIATWYGEKWVFGDPVVGWIGPLPIVNSAKLLEVTEYDL